MARRIAPLLFISTAALVLGLAAAVAPPAGATASSPSVASTWIDAVNWYRSMAHVAPVVDEPAWSDGLAHHLAYLHDTPASLRTGAYASAHTENPASPAHTTDGAVAGASADLSFSAGSEQATVDAWM